MFLEQILRIIFTHYSDSHTALKDSLTIWLGTASMKLLSFQILKRWLKGTCIKREEYHRKPRWVILNVNKPPKIYRTIQCLRRLPFIFRDLTTLVLQSANWQLYRKAWHFWGYCTQNILTYERYLCCLQ